MRVALLLIALHLLVACSDPVGLCDDHEPTEVRTLEIGNLDRSVPLGIEFPFVPYEDGQTVVKEFGTQSLTHVPIYLRIEARPEDGDAFRCAWLEYSREGFRTEVALELERRDEHWVTRLGYLDVEALGPVRVRASLKDAVFEGTAEVMLDAVEPIM